MQSVHTTILALLLMTTACSSSQSVEFLGFEGCPNTPMLRQRLVEASPETSIIDIDLMTLQAGDSRLGWGAPTILVDGKDLFGVPAAKKGSVSCRNWSSGLPTVLDIQQAMKAIEH